MNIRDREEALFAEWRKQEGCELFVEDGVVNEVAYNASNRKVAFILKQYGGGGTGDHDLREWELKDPCGARGWQNVADILRGINEAHNPSAKDGAMPDNICAFNLMKNWSEREWLDTDWDELKEVARRDRVFIRRQFEIYNPDLTLCMGYNWQKGDMLHIFREVMGHDNNDFPKHETQTKNKKTNEWGWYERDPGKVVVNTYHMSNRGQQSADEVLAIIKAIDGSR